MHLHEYQSKNLFAKFGIPTPKGKVVTSPQEAYDAARELGGNVVVKAQVLTGGRADAGGVRLAHTPDEARDMAETILGMSIKGLSVHKVLIDAGADIKQEMYISVATDRATGKPLMMASAAGRIKMAQIHREDPSKIVRQHIDPFLGVRDYQVRNLASGIRLDHEYWKPFTDIIHSLYDCFQACDATTAEINPLVITGSGQFMALDGKIVIDDNALWRHPDLVEMRDLQAEPPEETRAREAGLSYVKLDGNIGCMVNGAGLAMTTMDITKDIAAKMGIEDSGPANFLDIGGGAKADKVAAALRIILSEPKVKVVLLNIFGGITRCDEVAHGILQALREVKTNVPMVVRLAGTNAIEGRAIIDGANIPNIQSADTLIDAAQKAVLATKDAKIRN